VHHLSEPTLALITYLKERSMSQLSSIIAIHNCGKSGAETDVDFQ
jgi:hypothetical protein